MFSLLPYTESILKSPAGQMIYCHISIKSPYNQIFLRTGTKCRQSVVKKHFNGTFLLPFSQNKKARLTWQALTSWRREGDSNPRAGIRRQHDFQSCTLNRSDTSPSLYGGFQSAFISAADWLIYYMDYTTVCQESFLFLHASNSIVIKHLWHTLRK